MVEREFIVLFYVILTACSLSNNPNGLSKNEVIGRGINGDDK
jgi:hypothetical protein